MTIDLPLEPTLDSGSCPHLAVLLRTEAELYPTLASFYALGAKRGGFLVHRSLQGERDADRARLAAAGLDVALLESEDRLRVVEFDPDEPPEASAQPWKQVMDQALARGHNALWYSRFAVGPDDEEYRRIVPFERAWDTFFAGQPVVTLCPYFVGALDGAQALERLRGVSETHEGVLITGNNGLTLLRPAADG